MKISSLKLYISLFAILFITHAKSQEHGIKRDLHFEYTVDKDIVLNIENIYGDIEFNSYKGNKIIVDVVIKSESNFKKKAQKRLDNIKIINESNDSIVNLKTVFFKKRLMYVDEINKLEISYKIKIPIDQKINVKNKYGNIVFKEHHGKINLNLSKGNLTANSFLFQETQPLSSFKLKYSDVNIKTCNMADFDLQYVNFNVEDMVTAIFRTMSSKVYVNNVTSVKIASFFDEYSLGNVNKVKVNSKRTNFYISKLGWDLNYVGSKGNFTCDFIESNFNKVNIENSNAKIYVKFQDDASYKITANAKYGKVVVPKKVNIDRHSGLNSEKITGRVGSNKNPSSEVEIKNNYGNIIIK